MSGLLGKRSRMANGEWRMGLIYPLFAIRYSRGGLRRFAANPPYETVFGGRT
jgi:hypothetical protein